MAVQPITMATGVATKLDCQTSPGAKPHDTRPPVTASHEPQRGRESDRPQLAASGVRPALHEAADSPLLDARAFDSLGGRRDHHRRLAHIGTLTASVVHEINNPAAMIMANCTTMRSHVTALSTALLALEAVTRSLPHAEQLRIEGTIERADMRHRLAELREMCDDNLVGIEHISRVVAQLRTFSRKSHEVSTVDLVAVVRQAARMMERMVANHARLVLCLEPVPELPGEPTHLTQLVMNLLANACQAIEGSVDDNSITVSTSRRGERNVVMVTDTGRGMTPAVQAKIFEPFFTTKDAAEGTGLGLALCRDIAREHGGAISCSSSPGQGTCFEVSLPTGR